LIGEYGVPKPPEIIEKIGDVVLAQRQSRKPKAARSEKGWEKAVGSSQPPAN